LPASRTDVGVPIETKAGCVRPTSLVAIVDDDESVRQATESLVRSLGHIAMTFASAEAFLRSEYLERVTCVITDVKMPGMTGVQLQNTLLAQRRNLPIIFMTAYPEARVREQVLAAGAIGFLSKPFDSADMIICLTAALGGVGIPLA
jgi:FixJ family two-component response regulator